MEHCDNLINVEIRHGGRFTVENQYIGGKVEIETDIDCEDVNFREIDLFVKNLGYHSCLKLALREVTVSEKYAFFHDEESLNDIIMLHVDWTKKCLRIFVQALFADLTECDNENGVLENVTAGGSVTQKLDGDDIGDAIVTVLSEEEGLGGDKDDIFLTDSSYGREESDRREDRYFSDGMEDKDFSSDEEFIEARKKVMEDRIIEEQDRRVNILQEGVGGYQSESENSDTSAVSLDSNEEGDFIKRKKNKRSTVYAKNCDHKTLKLEVGLRFKDGTECKEAVRMWAILNGHNIKWKKSGGVKLHAVCEQDCPWMLYASKLNGEPTYVIKTYISDHKCVRPIRNRQATSAWLENIILPVLKRNPRYPIKDMIKDIQLSYGTEVLEGTCYRAKCSALKRLRGTYESHYGKLRSYVTTLRNFDRTGRFELKTYLDAEEKPVFHRIYIGFSALKTGFMVGCRKAIGFDACFLKTVLGGALLSAVAKDCNNKMYPVAWAVVEKENQAAWTWFFDILFQEMNISDGCGWTFMSDKHKGLIGAIKSLAPHAEHRHCARHVYANWKKKWSGPKFKLLFWYAVKSTSESQFKHVMEEMKNESTLAYEDFYEKQPKAFCKSLVDMHTKTDVVDNNICETFNSYILKFRDEPLIDMLDDIRLNLMTRMQAISKSICSSSDILCPNVRKKVERMQGMVNIWTVLAAVGGLYEVHSNADRYIVNLPNRECSCRLWKLTGLPCCHALACINYNRDDPSKYTDVFYHRSTCIEAYKHALKPFPGPKEWPIVNEPPILPPKFVMQPGRPKKARRRDPTEEPKKGNKKWSKIGVKMTCRACGQFGHNRSTCSTIDRSLQLEAQDAPKRKPGRPKKVIDTNEVGTTVQPKSKGKRGRPPKPKSTHVDEEREKIKRKEKRLTKQGYGVRIFESGNSYVRAPGARHVQVLNVQVEEGSSQRSQVDDGISPPC